MALLSLPFFRSGVKALCSVSFGFKSIFAAAYSRRAKLSAAERSVVIEDLSPSRPGRLLRYRQLYDKLSIAVFIECFGFGPPSPYWAPAPFVTLIFRLSTTHWRGKMAKGVFYHLYWRAGYIYFCAKRLLQLS